MPDQDKDIFNKEGETIIKVDDTTKPDDTSVTDKQVSDLLASIVQEDGSQKYASVGEALKGLAAAGGHISKIEKENADLRGDLEGSESAKDILEQIKALKKDGDKTNVTTDSADVTKLVGELVPQLLSSIQENATKEDNLKLVIDKVEKVYGDKASEMFYAGGEKLGLSRDAMKDLASSTPAVVFKILGLNETPDTTKHMKSDLNTRTLNDKDTSVSPLKIPKGANGKDFARVWSAAKDLVNSGEK